MNISLQDKLQKFREEKLIPEFKESFTNLECFDAVEMNRFPIELIQAIRFASKISTPRESRISCKEDDPEIFAWVKAMFVESGVGTQDFYLSTPFKFLPWLECRVTGGDWVGDLDKIYDLSFYAISSDKRKFLDIVNGEYWLDAFWCDI